MIAIMTMMTHYTVITKIELVTKLITQWKDFSINCQNNVIRTHIACSGQSRLEKVTGNSCAIRDMLLIITISNTDNILQSLTKHYAKVKQTHPRLLVFAHSNTRCIAVTPSRPIGATSPPVIMA